TPCPAPLRLALPRTRASPKGGRRGSACGLRAWRAPPARSPGGVQASQLPAKPLREGAGAARREVMAVVETIIRKPGAGVHPPDSVIPAQPGQVTVNRRADLGRVPALELRSLRQQHEYGTNTLAAANAEQVPERPVDALREAELLQV